MAGALDVKNNWCLPQMNDSTYSGYNSWAPYQMDWSSSTGYSSWPSLQINWPSSQMNWSSPASYNSWMPSQMNWPVWQTPTLGVGDTFGANTSSSSTSTSTTNSSSSVEEYEKKKAERIKKDLEIAQQQYLEKNASPIFNKLTKKEVSLLVDYSAKKLELHENLGQSLAMGAGMGILLPNMGEFTHPASSIGAAFNKNSVTNQMFKDVVKQDIWKKEAGVMQAAYAEMFKSEARANKLKWLTPFKRRYTADEMSLLKDTMENALQTGDKQKIIEATAKLQEANKVNQGWFSQLWCKIRRKPVNSNAVAENLNKTNEIMKGAASLTQTTNMSFKNCLTKAVGGKVGGLFLLSSIAFEIPNVMTGFKKDSKTGWKQIGQSIAKTLASWGGYVLGDAVGKWGGAKIGAMIGSAVCPGLGTAIGAVAGVVCGTVCSWGLRTLTNKLVGDNVVNAVNAQEKAENPETQAQFLQEVVYNAQNDKNIDKATKNAIDKAAAIYLA